MGEAAARLGLRHVVVTSVTRDDLPDGGAFIFEQTIKEIRAQVPDCDVEVLIPDFKGDRTATRAAFQFFAWCDEHGLTFAAIQSFHVSAYVEQFSPR